MDDNQVLTKKLQKDEIMEHGDGLAINTLKIPIP